MSLLSDALARSLEVVKREAETPLERSLRAEVAGLTARLKVLQGDYDSRCLQVETLDRQRLYRHDAHRTGLNRAVSIRDVRVEPTLNAADRGHLITARLMIDDMALRGFSEADLRDEIAGMLAAQLAKHVYESHIAPERPERAQDPSSEHKVTQSQPTPLPGYPLQDTRPPLAGPLKFIK